jgi:two-component system, OmpR family, sensor histidine kinase MtrB
VSPSEDESVRTWKFTLRWRVAVAFGLGSLLLTAVLALATWRLASGYLLEQRESSVARQAEVNALLVALELRMGGDGLHDLLTGLTTGSESTVLVERPQGWVTSGQPIDPAELPPALLAPASEPSTDPTHLHIHDVSLIAVARPLPGVDGVFIQLSPLSELERTLRFLAEVLAAGVAASGVFGTTLGLWAGRRALRPLTELTAAASRVARGDLQARLPRQADPELAPLAAAFNDTADALEARVRRDARFAGDVSHELRSPLTTMANAAAVLRRRRGELSETADRALELLLSEVDRFQRMVVDLLAISRDDQQPADISGETVDLGELVRNVINPRAGPRPELEITNPAPVVHGDPRRLERVVANLLDNADKYAGGPVRVAVLRRDGRARLEIDDAGPGVPTEFREQVFERFTRGALAGHRGQSAGSGLGLALVAQHVRRQNGTVWVEDRPGGGARFVVELPVAER